jgi:hypothetical protein
MKSTAALPLLICGLMACAGVGESADSTKIVPVDDIHARDTTPTPPPPPVSQMALMDSFPQGGICSVKRYSPRADQAREIYYETGNPMRTFVMEIGKPPRRFPPVSLDIRQTTMHSDRTEIENVYVGFSDDGKVSVGTRRYTVTGAVNSNDRAPLKMADSAAALSFAQQILTLCDGGR